MADNDIDEGRGAYEENLARIARDVFEVTPLCECGERHLNEVAEAIGAVAAIMYYTKVKDPSNLLQKYEVAACISDTFIDYVSEMVETAKAEMGSGRIH